MKSIADIKNLIASGQITQTSGDIIEEGILLDNRSEDVSYQLFHGWDIVRAHQCDEMWGLYNMQLLDFIQAQNFEENRLNEVLATIQVDDSHWKWFKKHFAYQGPEYNWFFLVIDNIPQAACLIYHPKQSAIDGDNIFYIEYIAVAPWNRQNPMSTRQYCGVGSAIIRDVIKYATEELSLRYGFCLHALPRAAGFYAKIGMDSFSALDKDTLQYFEMSAAHTKLYMEAS